jgi:predicted small secreted protein
MKRSISFVLCLVMVLALSACNSQKGVAEDIVGTWVEGCVLPLSGTGSCATFTFSSDGTFGATDIYQGYFYLNHPETTRIDRLGTWSLEKLSYDVGDQCVVHLTFDPDLELNNGFGYQSVLFVERNHGEINLYAWVEDEIAKIIFTKDSEQ